jgi:carbamoyl-phosphate synthase large subunit
MQNPSIHILMTGGGAPGAAGILNCLQKEGGWKVTVADANPEAYGKYLCDDFVTIPVAIAPLFTDELLRICAERKIDVIMPLVTRELLPLATEKEKFEKEGVRIVVGSAASVDIANDKGKLYQFLDWRGITVPAFRIINTVEQFVIAVKELGYPESAVCFKPTVSNGSRGFRILSEKVNELDLLLNQKPTAGYISLDEAARILSQGSFPDLLVTELLPGEEYSVDCLAKHGEMRLAVPRLRKKMINGISVEGEVLENEQIINYCRQIIESLQLHGNIGIQVKKAGSGEFLVLEINPRVQGSISACLGAGVNLPVLSVKQELGLEIAPSELQVKWGTRFSRYWQDLFY